ncbi:hypothetical protein [Streptomyces antibioticus]
MGESIGVDHAEVDDLRSRTTGVLDDVADEEEQFTLVSLPFFAFNMAVD